MIGRYIVKNRSLICFSFNLFTVAFCDRRAIAVGSGDKQYIFFAQAIAEEACKKICRNKDACNMSKVQIFVAVWHATGDNGSFGKVWTARNVRAICHENLAV